MQPPLNSPHEARTLIRDLPNELIVILGTYLEARDLYTLILVSRRFADLLLSHLHRLATRQEYAKPALFWATLSGDTSLTRLVLEKAENIVVSRNTRHIFRNPTARTAQPIVFHRTPGTCNDATLDRIMSHSERLLLKYGVAEGSEDDDNGNMAVDWAVLNDHNALLELWLTKYGSGGRYKDPLAFAISTRKQKAVETVLAYVRAIFGEAEHSSATDYALISLEMESTRMDEEGTSLLLRHGANRNALATHGNCHWLELFSRYRTVAILENSGAAYY